MPALQHVYLTAHGSFTESPWADERAQIGLRLALQDDDNMPAKGAPFTINANHGDVALETGATAGTNGTLSQTWTARLGGIGSTENADAAWQIDLAEDFRAFLYTIRDHIDTAFSWTHIKIAPILADGNYGFPGASTYDFTTALAGTAAGNMMPPEVACAVSLRAPISGRTGRGRFYLPAFGTAMAASNGTVSSTVRASLASAMVTLVTALEDSPGDEVISPCVMVTSAGKATAVRPSEVRIGDHFDAQRRRQHQAVETYTTSAL